jgi:hypothetical protein
MDLLARGIGSEHASVINTEFPWVDDCAVTYSFKLRVNDDMPGMLIAIWVREIVIEIGDKDRRGLAIVSGD